MNENDKQDDPEAQPYAHIYEFDSAVFGTHRSFSPSQWNGIKPTRTVAVYTHPSHPVQPAGAKGEPVAYLHLISDNNDKESFVVDFNKTHPLSVHGGDYPLVHPAPAAEINEKMLKALKKLIACPAISEGDILNPEFGCEESAESVRYAEAAIAAAEAAKGGV